MSSISSLLEFFSNMQKSSSYCLLLSWLVVSLPFPGTGGKRGSLINTSTYPV